MKTNTHQRNPWQRQLWMFTAEKKQLTHDNP
jgi:hypothetical protein